MPSIINIQNLTKRYGSVTAIGDISLEITSTEPIGLIGKNGAGKTTLLSILSGASQATSGKIELFGHSPDSFETKSKLSILLQDADFKPGIPVRSQLFYFARLQGLSEDNAHREITSLLQQLHNADYASKKPETLSYGQRKRLGIVQALIGQPELVLLDEPTAGLDPVAASDIRRFIQAAAKDTTFIVSSHNLYEIEDICSTIIVLDKGKLISHSKISEFSGKNNSLSLTLDREVTESLANKLLQLADITDYIPDKSNPEKFTVCFASRNPDELQLKIQSIIIAQGFSINHLNRGKTLADGVIDLVNTRPSSPDNTN